MHPVTSILRAIIAFTNTNAGVIIKDTGTGVGGYYYIH